MKTPNEFLLTADGHIKLVDALLELVQNPAFIALVKRSGECDGKCDFPECAALAKLDCTMREIVTNAKLATIIEPAVKPCTS